MPVPRRPDARSVRVMTRAQWQAWLLENHAAASGIWLTIAMTASEAGLLVDDAIEEALCFGWVDAQACRLDDERRARRFVPPDSVWWTPARQRARELLATLRADPVAWAVFRGLPGSRRRAEVRWVLGARSDDGRRRRLDELISRLLLAALTRPPGEADG